MQIFVRLGAVAGLAALLGMSWAPAVDAGVRPAAGLTLTVNAGAGRHSISPNIYGLNFAKEAFAAEIDLPVRRWGGNTTTRYNWTNNAMNHGLDWYFHNNANYDIYTGQTETADDWFGQNARTHSASLFTVPILGYVAKDTTPATCGFPRALYPNQADFDGDCGNGYLNGQLLPPAADNWQLTSQTFTPADAQAWVAHLVQAHGAASAGGVQFYALDNEPGIADETHHDLGLTPWGYAASIQQGQATALAIKAADPAAQVLGPVQDGWQRFFYASYSNANAANANAERQAKGDFIPWYLSQMKAYQDNTGVRLLDYLDLHFYPQNGVDQVAAGDAARQAARLESIRALWDPTYVDQTWIAQANLEGEGGIVRLIPRMHAWADTDYPGTKLALTEYNWGGLEDINGALAQADILGIFGREGLDLATLWNYPAHTNQNEVINYDNFETLPGAYAFRMFRNYDGQKSKFGDASVSAVSADQAQLAVYAAQRTSDSALTLMILNKTGGSLTGNVTLSGFTPGSAGQVYRYSAVNLAAILRQPDQAVTAAGFTADFPANSITLVVIPTATSTPPTATPPAGGDRKLYLPSLSR